MGSFSKIKKLLEEKDKFLLIGHIAPDGDCLGSLLALGEYLRVCGKKVTIACKDSVPEVFRFLPDWEKIAPDFLLGNFEAIILLDNGDFKRTGFAARLKPILKKIPVVNVDHHAKNDLWKLASINYADESASSTAELLYDILTGINAKITPKIATNLLTGIFNDTGGFRHPNTSPKVFKITADLLARGAKLKIISQNLSFSRSVSMLKLWGLALDRLIVNKKYQIISSVIFQKDLESVGATEEDVSGLVNLINSIPDCKIALLLYETADGKIKGSLRTESNNIDVAKLAKLFGGGGHKKAAGFMIDGKIAKEKGGWKVE